MSDLLDMFLLGLAVGVPFGAWFAWVRFLRHARPTLKITIDPQVLNQINGAMIAAWLDQRGLIAMPKGKEFKWPAEFKK